jgi:dTDP-4-dehydrorhamnose 3,5-epimerase
MAIRVTPTELKDVLVIEPDVFPDNRGYFTEVYHSARYRDAGICSNFVQDNLSYSIKGVIRGLHYQLRRPQAKLVSVLKGEVLDVVVDVRKGSPTFGRCASVRLSAQNRKQLFVPEGFAHGFSVLSDEACFLYKNGDFYTTGDEYGVSWCDPELGIDWGVKEPVMSDRDRQLPVLSRIPAEKLPVYGG